MCIVVAHPDDEVIGIGAQLSRFPKATLIHVTDGSPKNLSDAHAAGFSNAQDYACARRRELVSALAHTGNMSRFKTQEIGICDQEASLHLLGITYQLKKVFEELNPRFLFTHPYEGGHPDHDATTFAVHAACALLPYAPTIFEMTSYHSNNGMLAPGEFLVSSFNEVWTALLTGEEIQLKQKMFACFKTQERVLSQFPIRTERFRIAPHYDFTKEPHSGILYYEQWDFGIKGPRFRELAKSTLEELGIGGQI